MFQRISSKRNKIEAQCLATKKTYTVDKNMTFIPIDLEKVKQELVDKNRS